MENLLAHLKTKSFQNRTVGLMENGTWAPMAAKLMRAELESMKNITLEELAQQRIDEFTGALRKYIL